MKEKKSHRRKSVLRAFLANFVFDPDTGALTWYPRKRPKEPPRPTQEEDQPEFDELAFPAKPTE